MKKDKELKRLEEEFNCFMPYFLGLMANMVILAVAIYSLKGGEK